MITIKALLQNDLNSNLKRYANIDRYTRQRLLLEVLNRPSSFLISHADYCLTQDEQQLVFEGLEKLNGGMPFAYVVGHQPFWKLDFLVTKATLIPRPDTEILIETVLRHYKNSLSKKIKILDLGTGSGCIAISLANENPNWEVTAIDFSQEALEVAIKNAHLLKVKNITFLQGDWFEPLIDEQKFDIIVSNPPYIASSDPHLVNLNDEPYSALVAKDNGLADIKYLISQSNNFLEKNGMVFIEHGFDQGEQVRDIFLDNNYGEITTIKDYGKNDRVTFGRL